MRLLHSRLALPIILLVLGMTLTGCGQKGPLYLPSDEAATEQYGPRDTDDVPEDSDSEG
jgi:predicted small lipoprotein YifL